MPEPYAADLIHAPMSPEGYRLLVGDRGWTPERCEQWLGVSQGTRHGPRVRQWSTTATPVWLACPPGVLS
jgi:hypothetical protein